MNFFQDAAVALPQHGRMHTHLCDATLGAALLFGAAFHAAEPVQFPDGFRRWVHVGTGVIVPGTSPQLQSEEGMHHVFANPKAAAGYASGAFADGSVVVYELREFTRRDGVIVEGDRKRLDVMIKDARRYPETGGWRFERFWKENRTEDAVHQAGTECFQCHLKARAHPAGSFFPSPCRFCETAGVAFERVRADHWLFREFLIGLHWPKTC